MFACVIGQADDALVCDTGNRAKLQPPVSGPFGQSATAARAPDSRSGRTGDGAGGQDSYERA